ncbi:thioredoxin [Actibacterium mucosum KCTC 23349]|uniref:Thioredoxin n=1 Tax=Actibacterium mucosum KCTC 23349 TaxID=1454373 RepID=A0A037ZP07_9RHOB|nr:thioredoxin [Actibacterium mucosum]KAJ56551.1 thioredoxin [Actibacterium mucosum KCTC 23349]
MPIENVTDATFQREVHQSDLPVLVDFGTDWCAPCKAIEPVLQEIAAEMDGKVKIMKANLDRMPEVAQSLGVRGIPALFLFHGGQVVANRTGIASKRALQEWIANSV